MWDMTHSYVRHDSFISVTWLIHMCEETGSHVWHDFSICVTRLVYVCDIGSPDLRHSESRSVTLGVHMCDSTLTWLFRMCDETRACLWHWESRFVTRTPNVTDITYWWHDCDMTRSCSAPEPLLCVSALCVWVTWLIWCMCDMTHLICVCDMTHLIRVWHDSSDLCVTWLILSVCDMTHLMCVWHGSPDICVTQRVGCSIDKLDSRDYTNVVMNHIILGFSDEKDRNLGVCMCVHVRAWIRGGEGGGCLWSRTRKNTDRE